ncbi:hypothetical protein V496_06526 [Pseudogymnoascus sp. VKM F-4515 (FW-2607)]|nr:hypothetical protein V496_06526 [Pseudogymnoascus sp. VKM F-4515 (FW-2607)]
MAIPLIFGTTPLAACVAIFCEWQFAVAKPARRQSSFNTALARTYSTNGTFVWPICHPIIVNAQAVDVL